MSTFYKAWSLDEDILKDSSSGGVFTLIARYVLQNNGVVYGAEQGPDYQLRHIAVFDEEKLYGIRKSKYYQSDFSCVYTGVKDNLKNSILTLVTGTACQIQSLICYLNAAGISTDKLITIDVLCHGVSNKKVLEKYIISQEHRFQKKIQNVAFRTKEVPWYKGGGTSMTLFFEDGTRRVFRWKEDAYFLGFNNDLILRPSCYECRFVGMNRISDFTLGDFWGISPNSVEKKHLESGISLMVVNTAKAEEIISNPYFKKVCCFEEVDPATATPYNAAFHTRRKRHRNRGLFFDKYNQADFNALIKKCLFKEILIYKLKEIYHGIFG